MGFRGALQQLECATPGVAEAENSERNHCRTPSPDQAKVVPEPTQGASPGQVGGMASIPIAIPCDHRAGPTLLSPLLPSALEEEAGP